MEGGRLPSVVFESCLVRGGSASFVYSEGESLYGVPCLELVGLVSTPFRKGRKKALPSSVMRCRHGASASKAEDFLRTISLR